MKKSNLGLKVFILSMVFSLIFGSTSLASMTSHPSDEEKLVNELAYQIEFMMEEASIKDSAGNIINFDFDKLEAEFGASQDLEELKQIFASTPIVFKKPDKMVSSVENNTLIMEMNSKKITTKNAKNDAHNRCSNAKLKSNFGGTFFSISALALLSEYLWKGEYKMAAKKLIKMGIKSNVFVLVGTMGYIVGQCAIEVDKGKWR
ncbi:hypothetical protein [Cytobacillus horneckiae]|uniref:hypothetical protein n=1 Tax=Cytobacillus horneckiae TaxID=549687 RepID=UPI003D9AA84F